MNAPGTPFDIYRLLPDGIDENEIVNAGYIVINRMAALLGDITFAEIYTTPISDLIPLLAQNIAYAPDRFRDPERVTYNLNTLSRVADGNSILTLYQAGYDSLPPGVQDALYALLHQDAVYLPLLTGTESHDRNLIDGMKQLIAGAEDLTYRQPLLTGAESPASNLSFGMEQFIPGAGGLTYRQIFELAYNDPIVTPGKLSVLRRAAASGSLLIVPNDYCPNLHPPPNCISYHGGFCSMALNGMVSLASILRPCP